MCLFPAALPMFKAGRPASSKMSGPGAGSASGLGACANGCAKQAAAVLRNKHRQNSRQPKME